MKTAALPLLLALALPALAGTVTGRIPVADAREASHTIIYVEEVPESTFTVPATVVKLSQRGARFSPRVMAVVRNTLVDLTNDDWVTHNVFSKSQAKTFDFGLYGKDQRKEVKLDQLGVVELACSIHPRMRGVILVLQNPFFTRPAEDGSFTLKDVPAGSFKLRVYREGRKDVPVRVKVPATGTVSVEFEA